MVGAWDGRPHREEKAEDHTFSVRRVSLQRDGAVGRGTPGRSAGSTRTTPDLKGEEGGDPQRASSTGTPGAHSGREPRHVHPHFTLQYSHLVQPSREPEVPELMDAARWVSSPGGEKVRTEGGGRLRCQRRGDPAELPEGSTRSAPGHARPAVTVPRRAGIWPKCTRGQLPKRWQVEKTPRSVCGGSLRRLAEPARPILVRCRTPGPLLPLERVPALVLTLPFRT